MPAGGPPQIPGYEILEELGRGGMGVVYKARQIRLNRLVALKMILAASHASAEERARFKDEAEAVARLEHPHVVRIYDVGEHDVGAGSPRPYMALEFCAGGSLDAHLAGTPLPPAEAARLMRLLAEAVDFAHEAGIIHRDLKPANVLLSFCGGSENRAGPPAPVSDRPLNEFVPKITDFGLAKHLDQATVRTASGAIMGTPSYMAPEQAEGHSHRVGRATDVYALGAILYELLTGRPPFRAPTQMETVLQVINDEPLSPERVQAKLPRDLVTICLRCLHKDPARRYPTARALADDLARFERGEPIRARPVGLLERARRWARRRPAAAGLLGMGLLAVLLLGAGALWYDRRLRESETRGLVQRLASADTRDVSAILAELAPHRRQAVPLLHELAERAEPGSRQRLHAALALLPDDPGQADYLGRQILHAGPDELLLLRRALQPHAHRLTGSLWEVLEGEGEPPRRLRAACALAGFDPEGTDWARVRRSVAGWLVAENPLLVGKWAAALAPVRKELTPALIEVFRDRQRPESERSLAASILADYAAERGELLADLLADASPRQYAILWPKVRAHRALAVARFQAELERTLEPAWDDPPRPAWRSPAEEVRRRLTEAQGMLDEHFALCQTLPLERFAALAEGLKRAGYRPLRLRPYRTRKGVLVAALWRHDGRPCVWQQGVTAEEVRRRNEELGRQGHVPVDVAGYLLPGGEVRYAALWVRRERKEPPTRMLVGLGPGDYRTTWQGLRASGYRPHTQQVVSLPGGVERCSSVWRQEPAMGSWRFHHAEVQVAHEEHVGLGLVLQDVAVYSAFPPRPAPAPAKVWETWRRAVLARPKDRTALLYFSRASYYLNQDEKALAVLNPLMARDPGASAPYYWRALIHARLGRASAARADVARYVQLAGVAEAPPALLLQVGAHLGDPSAGTRALERQIAAHRNVASYLYDGGYFYAAAAGISARRQLLRGPMQAAAVVGLRAGNPWGWWALAAPPAGPDPTRAFLDRAVRLLREAACAGWSNFDYLLTASRLGELRQDAAFRALVAELCLERRYCGVWLDGVPRASRESHGLSPAAHLRRARALAARGFRPVGLGVAEMKDGDRMTASVWQRPLVSEDQRDALADRQASAATALLQLGAAERVWPLFRQRSDPRLRSWLIHRVAPLGTDPRLLVRRLEREKDVSARRALLLALGEFTPGQGLKELPPAEVRALVPHLLGEYEEHPDAGLHGALDWLLRQRWGQGAAVRRIDVKLAGRPPGRRGWYVSRGGQTFTIIRGPVTVQMGSPPNEPKRRWSEAKHWRRIGRSYAVATREVTVGEFKRFLKANPQVRFSLTDLGTYSPHDDGPVLYMDWYTAARYCNWLSDQEGIPPSQWCYPKGALLRSGLVLPKDHLSRTGYRLPTEAEWEHACRGGARTARYYGSTVRLLDRYGWYQGGAEAHAWPVGRLKPNDLGLFDMLGNAWEWCDGSGGTYPISSRPRPAEDGEEAERVVSDTGYRALRGGAFYDPAAELRCAHRGWYRPRSSNPWIGFRVVRTVR
jgi:formylglycine-generating enzyme required for sulfatase activity